MPAFSANREPVDAPRMDAARACRLSSREGHPDRPSDSRRATRLPCALAPCTSVGVARGWRPERYGGGPLGSSAERVPGLRWWRHSDRGGAPVPDGAARERVSGQAVRRARWTVPRLRRAGSGSPPEADQRRPRGGRVPARAAAARALESAAEATRPLLRKGPSTLPGSARHRGQQRRPVSGGPPSRDASSPPTETMKYAPTRQPLIRTDETGWRVGGASAWL